MGKAVGGGLRRTVVPGCMWWQELQFCQLNKLMLLLNRLDISIRPVCLVFVRAVVILVLLGLLVLRPALLVVAVVLVRLVLASTDDLQDRSFGLVGLSLVTSELDLATLIFAWNLEFDTGILREDRR